MNIFSSLSSFFNKEYDEKFKNQVAEKICDFYCDAPRNASLSHYYNKFKPLKGDEDSCDLVIRYVITKEINFYSSAAKDPKIKEMCDRHIEVLKSLQSIADKKLTASFSPKVLTCIALHILSWGFMGSFGAGLGAGGMNAIFRHRIIKSDTIFMSLTGSCLAAMCFTMLKEKINECLDYPENQKKQANWALKQENVVYITKNSRTYRKQFLSPDEYLLIKPYNITIPVTKCGVVFKEACEQAENLAHKYLDRYSITKLQAA